MIAATQHDRYVKTDYRLLQEQDISTARDGLRWHLIEPTPGRYDFSSLLPMVRAARETGMQIIWDLCYYGWPDDIDIFTPEFIRWVARFARTSIRVLLDESDILPLIVPVNEISFWSWAGGDLVCFSHLRWNFVYQQPQHLLSRCARERRVFYIEEPIFGEDEARLELSQPQDGLTVVVPRLPRGLSAEAVHTTQQTLINKLFKDHKIYTITLQYQPPAGKLGEAIAHLFDDPEEKLEEDLKRFKNYAEAANR